MGCPVEPRKGTRCEARRSIGPYSCCWLPSSWGLALPPCRPYWTKSTIRGPRSIRSSVPHRTDAGAHVHGGNRWLSASRSPTTAQESVASKKPQQGPRIGSTRKKEKVMKYVVVCLVLLGCSPPPATPTVSLSANPASVKQGQCATLTWSSTDASNVSIDQGVGEVDPSGSQQVCPQSTLQYTITAAGEGGSGTASTTVSVIALVTKLMIFPEAALFEFGKADLKPEGKEKIRRVPRTGQRRVDPRRQGVHHWLHRQRR